MLVGLTGRNASGKSTLVGWFSDKGLRSVSCSDSIRAWLREQGVDTTREALIEGGRELRRRGGAGVLAEMLLEILDGEDAVVDSIRTPAEVEALRSRGDFFLIEVRADEEARWQRMNARGRAGAVPATPLVEGVLRGVIYWTLNMDYKHTHGNRCNQSHYSWEVHWCIHVCM